VAPVDAVFKALSDPTRRQLLDTLRDRGGLTLTELEQGLGMTRFGVMKHLKVLEAANLVVTRRDGRFKHHYLNALPIQEVADRWMAPYGKPLARFALNIKNALESATPMADKPDFVFSTYIKTTPAKLWDALTKPEITAQYYYGGRVQADLRVGGQFSYLDPKGEINLKGEVLEIDPPRRLLTTFQATWAEPDAETTRVLYEIEPMGEVCKFTMTHYDYEKAKAGIEEGWPIIISGLKTLLETGKPLDIPMG
jgi:uncharacterized protein YndB with AHSA1/START domain/DNA-binding transcriptional ArsR family regulator